MRVSSDWAGMINFYNMAGVKDIDISHIIVVDKINHQLCRCVPS